ncbi:MAG TPA: hypothetical protein PKL88_03270 [bacterium]|nr:hypothetical protein [bacterium]
MNIELEEKISEILREQDRTAFVVDYEKVKKLSTLIQKERKEAVEGFAHYLLKRRNKDEFWGLSEGEVEKAIIVAKEYLESEGKK